MAVARLLLLGLGRISGLVGSPRTASNGRVSTRAASTISDWDALLALDAELTKHDGLYYNEAAPVISDAEYDALARERAALRTAVAAGRRDVGAKLSGSMPAAPPHLVPMLSLENLKVEGGDDAGAISKWLAKARRFAKGAELGAIVAEPKLDGLSASLKYIDGNFAGAATRGDGAQGDDVSANARGVGGVPQHLDGAPSDTIEVRGEVCLGISEFLALNAACRARGDKEFSSPRNAAAGSLRQLDAEETRRRSLQFIAHDLVGDAVGNLSYTKKREALERWGFGIATPALRVHLGVNATDADLATVAAQLVEYHANLITQRPVLSAGADAAGLRFEMDGAVYKVDGAAAVLACGATRKAPRGAVAHKFDADVPCEATRLVGIEVTVGRTGSLTPVALVEPVKVGGVTIKTASLHNEATLRRSLRGTTMNGVVLVKRAGDVIPQISPRFGPDEDAPPGDFDAWTLPEACPCCGTPTVRAASHDDVVCPAAFDCSAQATERLIHFIGRKALDFGSGVLGSKKLKQLVDEGVVRHAADLLELSADADAADRLAALNGWAKPSAGKLLGSLKDRVARPVQLKTFIYALGAPRVGQGMAEKISKVARTWDALWAALVADDDAAQAYRADLAATKNVGAVAVDSLRAMALDAREREVIERCAAILTIAEAPAEDPPAI